MSSEPIYTKDLPPYKLEATCPKCLHFGARSMYYPPEKTTCVIKEEYIKRICENCRYSWNEQPLDFQKEETANA